MQLTYSRLRQFNLELCDIVLTSLLRNNRLHHITSSVHTCGLVTAWPSSQVVYGMQASSDGCIDTFNCNIQTLSCSQRFDCDQKPIGNVCSVWDVGDVAALGCGVCTPLLVPPAHSERQRCVKISFFNSLRPTWQLLTDNYQKVYAA